MIITYLNKSPEISPESFIFRTAAIIGDVSIGEESSIWFNTVLRGDVNKIVVGKRTNIQDNTTIHVTTEKHSTQIGNSVTIGHNVVIHGSIIDDFSLIGMGAVILDGCQIGKNSIIAAGTVLKMHTKIPPGVVVAGNPGTIKRAIKKNEIDFFEKSASNYVKYSLNYLTSATNSIYSYKETKKILNN